MGLEDTLLEHDYLDGIESEDYGWYQKPNMLMEGYYAARRKAEEVLQEAGLTWDDNLRESDDEDLREAGSTSDFGTYLSALVTKRLMWSYREQPSSWRAYSELYSVPDFKPYFWTRLTEMEELLQIPEGGNYTDSALQQIIGPSMTVAKFGRLFTLTLEAIVNDDLNQLKDRPAAMGRAAARTLGHQVVNLLASNPLTYDGVALASEAHKNLLSGSQYALSENSLGQARTLLRRQVDQNENIIGLNPYAIVVPISQELTLDRAINGTAVPQPQEGITPLEGQQFGRTDRNVVARIGRPIGEDYLVDQNDWYMFAEPGDAPVLAVGFLNGRQTPDIFLADPGMRNVLGGSDPYGEKIDDISWKIRHFWGIGVWDWRGVIRAMVP